MLDLAYGQTDTYVILNISICVICVFLNTYHTAHYAIVFNSSDHSIIYLTLNDKCTVKPALCGECVYTVHSQTSYWLSADHLKAYHITLSCRCTVKPALSCGECVYTVHSQPSYCLTIHYHPQSFK